MLYVDGRIGLSGLPEYVDAVKGRHRRKCMLGECSALHGGVLLFYLESYWSESL